MANGVLSKGITLKVGATPVPDLQAIPDLGGDVDKLEITTLADSSVRTMNGIIDYGDLEFTFLYDTEVAASGYRQLNALEEAASVDEYIIELSDGTTFTFSGQVSTKIAGVGVNEALTFTAMISLTTPVVIDIPVI
jgi:hypothetical protein